MSRRRVAIGVTGGVAAYKTAMLVSRLVQSDFDVTTVLTAAASKFIGAATFAALTGKPPAIDAFDPHYPLGPHIEIAKSVDLLCIAPASADFLAKTAHGAADDLLSTIYLAFTGPVLMAPAMNREMWAKPSVQRNVQQLVDDGVEMIGPGAGWLSCRDQGAGRMSEPDEILAAIQTRLAPLS
ncbi:flavoprotein [Blastopirellula marina]|uniref:DNA/pantothenate metabolism flavoprotein n=1 Tax=Blastopirellula marina DSM 3645 TaxID=314230 RepID=A4A1G8_9BACT|nr:flavoprotein [Blastopirellula marina]EAQ77417.1 DNA/pantothenate metabolism flavoprotein [Blastopirellula marina DSM 3645]